MVATTSSSWAKRALTSLSFFCPPRPHQQEACRVDEQRSGQRYAHAPAATELPRLHLLHVSGEAEAMQDRGGTGFSRVAVQGFQAAIRKRRGGG